MNRIFAFVLFLLLSFVIFSCTNNNVNEAKSESIKDGEGKSSENLGSKENLLIIDSILKINENLKFFAEFANNLSEEEYNLMYRYLEQKQSIALDYYTLFVDDNSSMYCKIFPKFTDNKLISMTLSIIPSKSDEHSSYSNIGQFNDSLKISYFERDKVDKLINIYKQKYGDYDEINSKEENGLDDLRNLIFTKGNKRIEINTEKYYERNFEYKKDFKFKDKGKEFFNVNAPLHDYNNSEIVKKLIGYSNISINYIDLSYFNKEKKKKEIDSASKEKSRQNEINKKKQNTFKDI